MPGGGGDRWVAAPAGPGQGAGRDGGGAGAGSPWTSAREAPRPAAPIPLRASAHRRELWSSVGRHGVARGRARPGRGPGAALGGRRAGPHRGVGAAQVRGISARPEQGWRRGEPGRQGAGPQLRKGLWVPPALVSRCCRAGALQRLRQLP